MSDWDLNSRVNWDSYLNPPDEPDPPENCWGCGKFMYDPEDEDNPYLGGTQESEDRFYNQRCRCDDCWNAMNLRGEAICSWCDNVVAKSSLIGNHCQPCEDEMQQEEAYLKSEEANYPYGYSGWE